MKEWKYDWIRRRRRVAEIVEMRSYSDWVSRGYNILNCAILLLNVVVTILYTFDRMEHHYGDHLLLLEGDHIILYSQTHVPDADQISI